MGYQKDYYQKNREKILKERALRYAGDIQYRADTIARARLSNMNRRATPRTMATTVTFAGKPEKFHRVMDLPRVLDRHYSVIRQWRLAGIIPRPCCKDGSGRPVYAESQVRLLDYFLEVRDSDLIAVTYQDMKAVLHKFWRKRVGKREIFREMKRQADGTERSILGTVNRGGNRAFARVVRTKSRSSP